MRYLKTFNQLNESNIDFDAEVESLDKEWAEDGMTCDATDVYDELIKRFGEGYSSQISTAIKDFYQVDPETGESI